MATPLTHAVAAFALGKTFSRRATVKFLLLGMFCAVLPDADVLAFRFNIPYSSVFGHRGFTHSIFFALLLSWLLVEFFYRNEKRGGRAWLILFAYFFLCTISHAILDAMTNGGLGVAFFSPFSNERYFFPFRPVKVSPLHVSGFFNVRGIAIIKSEVIWIWIPCFVMVIIAALFRRSIRRNYIKRQ